MAASSNNSMLMTLLEHRNKPTNSDKFYPNYLNFVEKFGDMHQR
jgi:hypothetical protein